jgi:hypothetical protein
MMYFAWGYIIAVNFLKYSNYVSDNFFLKDENQESEEATDVPQRGNRNIKTSSTFIG